MKIVATLVVALLAAQQADAGIQETLLQGALDAAKTACKMNAMLGGSVDECIARAQKTYDDGMAKLAGSGGDGSSIISGSGTGTEGTGSSWFDTFSSSFDPSSLDKITDMSGLLGIAGETKPGDVGDIWGMFGKPDEMPEENAPTDNDFDLKKFWAMALQGGDTTRDMIKDYMQKGDFTQIRELFPTSDMDIPEDKLNQIKDMFQKFGVNRDSFDMFSGVQEVFSGNSKLGEMAETIRGAYSNMYDSDLAGLTQEQIQFMKDKLDSIKADASTNVMTEITNLSAGVDDVKASIEAIKGVAEKCRGNMDALKDCVGLPSDEAGFEKYCSVENGCVKEMIAKTNHQFECVKKTLEGKVNTEAIEKMQASALSDSKFAVSKICQSNFLADVVDAKVDEVRSAKFCGLRAKTLVDKMMAMQTRPDSTQACKILQLAGCCAKSAIAVMPQLKKMLDGKCVLELPKECPNPMEEVKVLKTSFNLNNLAAAAGSTFTKTDKMAQLGGLLAQIRAVAGDKLKELGVDLDQISAEIQQNADGLASLDLGIMDLPEDKMDEVKTALANGLVIPADKLPTDGAPITENAEALKLVEAKPAESVAVGTTLDLQRLPMDDTTSSSTANAANAALLVSLALVAAIIA